MPRGPTVEPLDGRQELEVRRRFVEALIGSYWEPLTWPLADRIAADLIDQLKGDGIELVKVNWR